MALSGTTQNGTSNEFGDLNLSITGLGVEYPPYLLEPSDLDTLCKRHYAESPAVRAINNYTGIDTRSAIGTVDHPMANMDRAPTIEELCAVFLKDGVALAVTAARKALHEAQLSPSDITHVVSTTCTNSANPGFDHFWRIGKPAYGSEPGARKLISGQEGQGVSGCVGDQQFVGEKRAGQHLGFDVHPLGWKVVLSPRVPKLAAAVVEPAFNDLISTIPNLPPNYKNAADFDWALHPGGATILSGVERAMGITPEHMRASYDTYINHGNSSSATIISVMDRLRQKDMDEIAPGGKVKDFVVGCAFGPGIAVETCILKRNMNHVRRTLVTTGQVTPPETESEGSRSEGEGELEADIQGMKDKGEKLSNTLSSVHPEVPEQGDSLTAALNGVDLD
ncbi:thiolase like protein [Hyphodiscus hymeniophilus]|uniref:Thiolase like protein n=1 Tax=Hyphodiscus hymeniophilus TaxID=353542 RepID=A0A9P6VPD5_9HELO|nr:thiolase like protein [Hyphodiscus hymeniophilus]